MHLFVRKRKHDYYDEEAVETTVVAVWKQIRSQACNFCKYVAMECQRVPLLRHAFSPLFTRYTTRLA